MARVELGSETYEQAGYLSGKAAATIPIYQYSNANALSIVEQVQARDGPPGQRTSRPTSSTGSPSTPREYVEENIDEVEHTLVEAFVLVLIVVFVFLQGLRTTLIPMVAIPVSLVATFGLMAAFGFSINTLTLMGLVLAIGLVVDDAIIVVENVEKYLERGLQPAGSHPGGDGRDHHADRHHHPGAGRRVRPRRLHPRPDRPALQPVRPHDRLLVPLLGAQLADLQPGHGPAVPQGQDASRRVEVLLLPLVQPGHEVARELLRLVPGVHRPSLVDDRRPLARLCWRSRPG